jgi:hypothetical protein
MNGPFQKHFPRKKVVSISRNYSYYKWFWVVMAIVLFILLLMGPLKRLSESSDLRLAAKAGELNLQDYDWENRPSLRLNGEWELYWHRLLTPEQLPVPAQLFEPPKLVKLPAHWNSHSLPTIVGLSGKGYATYRLNVTLDPSSRVFALQIPYIRTAYKVWINGELMAEVGKVGSDEASS